MLAIGFFLKGWWLVLCSWAGGRPVLNYSTAPTADLHHRMAVRDNTHLNRTVISALTSAVRLPREPDACSYLTLSVGGPYTITLNYITGSQNSASEKLVQAPYKFGCVPRVSKRLRFTERDFRSLRQAIDDAAADGEKGSRGVWSHSTLQGWASTCTRTLMPRCPPTQYMKIKAHGRLSFAIHPSLCACVRVFVSFAFLVGLDFVSIADCSEANVCMCYLNSLLVRAVLDKRMDGRKKLQGDESFLLLDSCFRFRPRTTNNKQQQRL